MAEIGMQMPGAQRRRRASLNVYTGLLLAAVACLGGAVGVVFYQGQKIGPGDGVMSALTTHEDAQRLDLGR